MIVKMKSESVNGQLARWYCEVVLRGFAHYSIDHNGVNSFGNQASFCAVLSRYIRGRKMIWPATKQGKKRKTVKTETACLIFFFFFHELRRQANREAVCMRGCPLEDLLNGGV